MCRYLWIDSKSQIIWHFYSSLWVRNKVTKVKGVRGSVMGTVSQSQFTFPIPDIKHLSQRCFARLNSSLKSFSTVTLISLFSPLIHYYGCTALQFTFSKYLRTSIFQVIFWDLYGIMTRRPMILSY